MRSLKEFVRLRAFARLCWMHACREGPAVAFAWLARSFTGSTGRARRDPGEKAAERFLRGLGYGILARNWRSPRDPRDEADLIAITPDGADLVIVEVKRTATSWGPLDRVDSRKRAALWRILRDLEDARIHRSDRALARAIPRALRIRIDLVGVRGDGSTSTVVDYAPDILQRDLARPRRTRDAPLQARSPGR